MEKWKKKHNLFWFCESELMDNKGTYKQVLTGRPEVSEITCYTLHFIPMKGLDTWNKAGEKN